MRKLIVTDDEALGERLRRVLIESGHECPSDCIVGSGDMEAGRRAGRSDAVVVVDVGDDHADALAMIGRWKAADCGRLIAVGRLGTATAALRVRRAGAEEYIETDDVEAELPAVVDALTHGQSLGGRPGRVVAVVSPSGGGGASTVAANLAVTLAKDLKDGIALLDFVPATGSLADLLDLKPVHTLMDIAEFPERLDRDIFERTLVRHDSGVRLLASPRRYDARERIDLEAAERVVELARSRYPYVIVDLDRELGPIPAAAARAADCIVVLLRQEFTSLRDARGAMDQLERLGVPPARIAAIANRRGQPREVPASKVEEALRLKLAAAIPDDPRSVIRAANNGIPLVVEARSSRAARAITAVAGLVRARVETEPEVRSNGRLGA